MLVTGVDQPGRADPGDEHDHIAPLQALAPLLKESPMAGHILPWTPQSAGEGCIYHRGMEIWDQIPGCLFYVYPSRVKLVQKFLPPGPVDGSRSLLQVPVLTAVLLPARLPGDGFPHQDKV